MTKYQRALLNKIDDMTARLQCDWSDRAMRLPHMSAKERMEAEGELRSLMARFEATYKKA